MDAQSAGMAGSPVRPLNLIQDSPDLMPANAMPFFWPRKCQRVRAVPGVRDATISAATPPDDQWKQNFSIEGRPLTRLEDTPVAGRNATDSHYLRTLGIPVVEHEAHGIGRKELKVKRIFRRL